MQDKRDIVNFHDVLSLAESYRVEGERRVKSRTVYTTHQLQILEEEFSKCHYPPPRIIELLAIELDIPHKKIKVWFQNKRARCRRKLIEERKRKERESLVYKYIPKSVYN
ncbi:unnamed protein product [Dimorphilus gyrociliatus]|uniref:Homeobox domain-containing protein n=1 Tax=Dimorphilus gyrociliatus TaxID=2664684 RepID=A0A7I8VJW5_9ANNE|nr:unnamed protein product [Dimorphilus gyrociliatus]